MPPQSGTYRYRQKGQTTLGLASTPVPPEGTLVVDPPAPDGSQVSHRIVDPGTSTDTTLSFRSDGVFLLSTVLRRGSGPQAVSFTCRFPTPVPTPPWPPAVGKSFAGHGECGAFTIDAEGTIESARTTTLDGAAVEVFVVNTSLVTHGQLESTIHQVDWIAPSLRLVVHSESQQKGSAGPIPVGADVTSDLVSGRPV